MLKVFIPEPIPSLNKGELAILEGLREALNVYGKYKLTVYSPPLFFQDDLRNAGNNYRVVSGTDLYDLEFKFSTSSRKRSRFYNIKIWGKLYLFSLIYRISKFVAYKLFQDDCFHALADCDLILAGHDGLMGPAQYQIVLAGKLLNKKVVLYGGGEDISGRKKFLIRKKIQFAVKNALLCTVRDSGIKTFMTDNGVNPDKIHLFPDPAILLKPCSEKRAFDILKNELIITPETKKLYGLIPVGGGIVFHKSFSEQPDYDKKFELRNKFWAEIINVLIQNTDAHFIFIPHCIGPVKTNDDRIANRKIYELIENKKDRVTLIENEYSPSEFKGIMGQCQYVLGERAHCLIGSVSVATPCMALTVEEDKRMHWLMELMFNRPTYNLNVPDIEDLKKILIKEWNERRNTASIMKQKAIELHSEGYKAANLLSQRLKECVIIK